MIRIEQGGGVRVSPLLALTLAAVVALLIGAALFATSSGNGHEQTAGSSVQGPAADLKPSPSESPFSTVQQNDAAAVSADAPELAGTPLDAELALAEDVPALMPLDIASIGLVPWTNADYAQQLARLRADPLALDLLIDDFRAETDPARLERLAALLGEVGHPDLAGIAAQMVSSGDSVSRDAGLSLLHHLQPNDAGARETLIALLATESDPEVLKSVIDAVSIPGEGDEAQAGALVAQLVPLAQHPSAAVRRNGVAVLSRWTDDPSVTPVLQTALADEDAGVRASAVYAFADRPGLDDSVKQDLLAILENPQERRGTRSGAMLALQRGDLDTRQAQRLQRVEQELASTL